MLLCRGYVHYSIMNLKPANYVDLQRIDAVMWMQQKAVVGQEGSSG